MNLTNQVYLAAEDRLGLALGARLIGEQPALQICDKIDGGGYARLKDNVDKYNRMAGNGLSVLLLTDLDRRPCCTDLLNSWLGEGRKPNLNFLFRICVRESEAWLLAHPAPLARLFKLSVSRFPTRPESLADPKAELLKLAAKAPAKIRKALLPAAGSSATIGREYNDVLCPLVRGEWDIEEASRRAPSLRRARDRIRELALRIS